MKLSDSPGETSALNSAAVDSSLEDYDIEAHPVNEEQPRRSRCKPTEASRNMWYQNVFLFLLLLVGFGYIVYSNYGTQIYTFFEPHEYIQSASNLGNSTGEALSASMSYYTRRGSAHHRRRCTDTLYGCCLIAYQTASQISHGWLHEVSVGSLSPYFENNVQLDEAGSNCPHLRDFVGEMNRAYFPRTNGITDCESSQFGCCQIDITADEALHTSLMEEYGKNPAPAHIHADRSTWADFVPRNKINTAFQKSDTAGSNCPTASDVINERNSNYSGANWIMDSIALSPLALLILVAIANECRTPAGRRRISGRR